MIEFFLSGLEPEQKVLQFTPRESVMAKVIIDYVLSIVIVIIAAIYCYQYGTTLIIIVPILVIALIMLSLLFFIFRAIICNGRFFIAS